MTKTWPLLLALATAAPTLPAVAQELPTQVRRTPLPSKHPLVGAWRIDVPGTACHEVYDIHADGSMSVTSGEQSAQSEFEIDLEPSPRGFYRWVDKIVKDNGRPDCMGEVMEVGHMVVNFIIIHRSGREFLMCEDESLDRCIGPFKRLSEDT